MDHTIENVVRSFDVILDVLNKNYHGGDAEALEYLTAAKRNYIQRDIDHLATNLTLFFHHLLAHPPDPKLWDEVRAALGEFANRIEQAGSRMSKLARDYEAGGGKLLSRDEILQEVSERRGGSR
jgi:hypothetical protein